ncbi:hypothetical protein Goshw_019326 [Gossypium schwendimanii]|uniref:Uncharacterized protein n=1 Tax=Gossypium schwendimanii TaxID=34291 RepID=A0A7J9MP05_GOSSC|nr:hypothetical protein [Gossypium schwendimanii]
MVGAHIVFFGLCFMVVIWHWIYWDLEIFYDERTGKPSLICPIFLELISFSLEWLALALAHFM